MGITSTSSDYQSTSDSGCFNNYTRRDDVLSMTCTDEGTFNTTNIGGSNNENDNESNADPIRELSANGSKIVLFSKLEPVLTEPKGSEWGEAEEEEEDSWFTAYSFPVHMHNVDLLAEDGLKFAELPHRRSGHASSLLDSGNLEAGKEFFH